MNTVLIIGAHGQIFHLIIDLLKYRSLLSADRNGTKTMALERKVFR